VTGTRRAKAARAASPTPVTCAGQDASGRDHSTRRAGGDLRGGRAGDACRRRGPHRRRRRRHRQLGRACQDRQLADRRPGSDGARDGGGRDGRSGRLRRGRAARGRRGDDTSAAAPASRDVGREGARARGDRRGPAARGVMGSRRGVSHSSAHCGSGTRRGSRDREAAGSSSTEPAESRVACSSSSPRLRAPA
jgi:hypothetical protein